jgi:predicted RNA binding protein YcfA (HicA-like mRNA interferase family)
MKVPRDLGGQELVKVLCRDWGYWQVHQEGSHVVLQTEQPFHHRIAVPAHKSLRIGTLNAILKTVARHKNVSRDDILRSLG